MFSTNFKKIFCIFAENKIFEKIQDGGHCCHSNSSLIKLEYYYDG